jgi:hypothetical protein
MLPAFLKRTNVVLEIRDSRLPLTSINGSLEGKGDAYLVALYSGPAIEMNTGYNSIIVGVNNE